MYKLFLVSSENTSICRGILAKYFENPVYSRGDNKTLNTLLMSHAETMWTGRWGFDM